MQADLDREDSAPKISVVIASGMHFDQSTSESLSAELHSVLPAVSREYEKFGLTHAATIRQRQQIMDTSVARVTCSSAADTEASEMAGLHVGDCVLRRGQLHTVVAIDRSLSPIACTVQNHTTGAVVATELSFLSRARS